MGVGRPISMDKERVSFNLAKLKKAGKNFEIVLDPDKAVAYKQGEKVEIKEIIRGEKIFSDAKKGVFAAESDLKAAFNSIDPLKIASAILESGDIQLTTEYREKLIDEKKRRIIYLIHRNAADPKTKLPHPITRIESAFEEAKCRVDEYKSAEEQIDEIVKKLRVVLPLKIESVILQINIPPQQAHQAYGVLKKMGEIKQESWGTDGRVIIKMYVPAGMQEEIMSKMNSMTHGGVDIKIVGEEK